MLVTYKNRMLISWSNFTKIKLSNKNSMFLNTKIIMLEGIELNLYNKYSNNHTIYKNKTYLGKVCCNTINRNLICYNKPHNNCKHNNKLYIRKLKTIHQTLIMNHLIEE